MDSSSIHQHNFIGIDMNDNWKHKSMKEILLWMKKEFGDDINYRVKLSDGRIFKSLNWDAKNKYVKFQNEQKQSRKLSE